MKELRNIIYGSMSVVYGDQVVMLVSRKSEGFLSTIEMQALKEFLHNNNLVAGLSRCFKSPLQVSKYYIQSQMAMEMGLKMNWGQDIYNYGEYSIFHIIENCSDKIDLLDLCHPSILFLKDFDEVNNTSFLETLYYYLKFEKNPTLTSSELHIHRSTLFYRIEKIKKMTEIDLNNGDVIFELQLSFKLLEYISK